MLTGGDVCEIGSKRKLVDTEMSEEKLESVEAKKLKTETSVMEKYNIVRGAMLKVIQKEVTKALNYLCTIQVIESGGEHTCMSNPVEDIIFCHVGLIQKYHTAYTLVKKEVADVKLSSLFVDQICQALQERGLSTVEAKRFSSIEVFSVLIGHMETYSQIFECLREKLLTLHLVRPDHSDEKSERNAFCLKSNFGVLNI